MTNQTKRYLVTYTDGSISNEKATGLLGITKSKCIDGVSFMETDVTPTKDDVLHFENLGVTSIELTEKDSVNLAKQEGILAVEEDLEMFAFKSEMDEELQYSELFLNEFDTLSEDQNDSEGAFDEGYNKALLDLFSNLLEKRKGQPIGQNQQRVAPFAQPIPWNISLVKAPAAWARGINGSGINVAILDTGITSHPDLSIRGGVSFIPGSASFNDLHGHGTHCAGIVAARNNNIGVVGVAPNANLYAVKVLNDQGSGQTSWIIAGMEWCVRNRIKVASMSLGGKSGPMTAYATAVKRCQDNGVTVVVASGNSFGSAFPWVCAPANSVITGQVNASPIAVGAVDRACRIAPFSSRGGQSSPWNQVSCVAPGVAVNSTFKANGYISMSGTSMACPHVAGLAALIIQRYPGISPYNVKRRINQTCSDLGAVGYDLTFGFGLINCDRATI